MKITAAEILSQIENGATRLPIYAVHMYEFPFLHKLSEEYNKSHKILKLVQLQLKHLKESY